MNLAKHLMLSRWILEAVPVQLLLIIFDQPNPSEVSDKPLETVVAAPADAHEETPDATWNSDLGMQGMRCAIVLECILRSYRGTI